MTDRTSDATMSEALAVFDAGGMPVKYKLTRTALVIPDGVEFEVVDRMVRGMKIVGDSVRFWLGDLLNYAERNYGEMYAQLVDASDFAYQSLQDMMWVSGRIAPAVRRDELTWSHHREVAKLDIDRQRQYLEQAVLEGLTVLEMRSAIAKKEKAPKKPSERKVVAYEMALRVIKGLAYDSGLVVDGLLNDKLERAIEVSPAQLAVSKIVTAIDDVLNAYGVNTRRKG